jgi:hypothetical protein
MTSRLDTLSYTTAWGVEQAWGQQQTAQRTSLFQDLHNRILCAFKNLIFEVVKQILDIITYFKIGLRLLANIIQ